MSTAATGWSWVWGCCCDPELPLPPDCIDCRQHDPGIVSVGHPEFYEYALMLCNINAAKDDVFKISLNGAVLGFAPELGLDLCGGRIFVTDPLILTYILNWKNAACVDFGADIIPCCFNNAATQTVPKSLFLQTNWIVLMNNVLNNNNGNFGGVYIWKLRRETNPIPPPPYLFPDPCLFIWSTNYSAFSGSDITIDFGQRMGFNPQTLV